MIFVIIMHLCLALVAYHAGAELLAGREPGIVTCN